MMLNRKSITLQDIFFFLFLVILSIIFFEMLKPFLVDLFLTLVLGIMFQKVFQFFLRKPKISKSLAATITIVIVIFTLVIPLSFVGFMVTKEVAHNYHLIKNEWPTFEKKIKSNDLQKFIDKQPQQVRSFIDNLDTEKVNVQFEEFAKSFTGTVLKAAQETFLSFTTVLFHILMIIFFLFFIFVDGQSLQERIQFLIPFDDKNEQEFMTKMKDVTEAITFNTFLVGAIEGTWGGILLAIAGVPSPFFWGTMMVLLSVIPLVGANAILFPTGIILLLIGNTWEGLMILILGTGVIMINQNFIKPRIDGQRSGMHPAIVVIASLGGMFWMGLIGFLAGPFLAAAFLVIWDQFGKKYERELTLLNSGGDLTHTTVEKELEPKLIVKDTDSTPNEQTDPS